MLHKKLYDLILITLNNIHKKTREILFSPGYISRSFWATRDSTNWDLTQRYPELKKIQTEKLIKLFQHLELPQEKRILDLGCSDGSCSSFVVDGYVDFIYGLDISPEFIKSAKNYADVNKINAKFDTWDAYKTDIPKEKLPFDVVMALGLFTCIIEEYIFDKILSQIYAVLSDKGIFILKDTLAQEDCADKVSSNYLYAAKYRFIQSYIKKIQDHGFKKLDLSIIFQFPSEPYASYFLVFEKI